MKIEPITSEMAERYREQIAQLYYENVRSNAFHSHYTYDEAYEKIGSLIDHLRDDTAIVYSAFEDGELIAFIWAYVHQFREERLDGGSAVFAYRNGTCLAFGHALRQILILGLVEILLPTFAVTHQRFKLLPELFGKTDTGPTVLHL